jgi:hypothetical protein
MNAHSAGIIVESIGMKQLLNVEWERRQRDKERRREGEKERMEFLALIFPSLYLSVHLPVFFPIS